MTFSVVIPACNEEHVIGRTLRTMLTGATADELEIVVACNGCTDATAEAARAVDPSVRVVETIEVGKAAGLNLGDRAVDRFPRVYADADVLIDAAALRATVRALERGALAAAPSLTLDLERASWIVKAYYRVWTWARERRVDLQGSGIYALSEAGRGRFGAFPPIIADDLFVYGLFGDHERTTASDARVVVQAPNTVRDLIHVKSRVFVGKLEYTDKYGAGSHGFGLSRRRRHWLGLPARLWPSATVYVGVQLLAKSKARRRFKDGDVTGWNRNEAARRAAA